MGNEQGKPVQRGPVQRLDGRSSQSTGRTLDAGAKQTQVAAAEERLQKAAARGKGLGAADAQVKLGKKKSPAKAEVNPFVDAGQAHRRQKMAEGVERRMQKQVPQDVGKAKREKNWDILFGDEDEAKSTSMNVCVFCGKKLQSQTSLELHLKRVHEKTSRSPSPLEETEAKVTMDEDESKIVQEKIQSSLLMLWAEELELIKPTLTLLQGLCRNILKNPDNDKYRSLRLSNPKVQEAIFGVNGAMEVLLSIGFAQKTLSLDDGTSDEYLVFAQDQNLARLQIALNAISSNFQMS